MRPGHVIRHGRRADKRCARRHKNRSPMPRRSRRAGKARQSSSPHCKRLTCLERRALAEQRPQTARRYVRLGANLEFAGIASRSRMTRRSSLAASRSGMCAQAPLTVTTFVGDGSSAHRHTSNATQAKDPLLLSKPIARRCAHCLGWRLWRSAARGLMRVADLGRVNGC